MKIFNDLVHWEIPGVLKQITRIMKLITIMMTAFLMQVSAATFSQQLTIKNDRIKMDRVFEEIRKQTGYTVLCRYEVIKNIPAQKLNLQNTPLEEALSTILKDKNLEYQITDKAITIKRKDPSFLDRLVNAFDNIDVRGRVVDDQGAPLPGATIKVKGTTKTAITDQGGNFYLQNVDENATLTITYVGFGEKEVKAEKNVVVTLKMTTGNLNEVVVNKGYYKVKQELNTGSVTTVTAKEISKQPVSDFVYALSGLVPGLQITQPSGLPGANPVIMLRGQNSIANGNTPLFLINGIPFNANTLSGSTNINGALGVPGPTNGPGKGISPFDVLNPSDIESVTILKDADATAIYGSRGANGVILITTKKGIAGATQIDVNAFSGFGEVGHKINWMDTQQYLQMRREALKNDNVTAIPTSAYDLNGVWDQNRYTDWQDMLIGGTAKFNNVQATLSGGTENTQYLLGTQYSNQTTVFPGDFDNEKISGNFSLNHRSISNKFQAAFSSSYLISNNNIPNMDFTSALAILPPNAPAAFDSNGKPNWEIINNVATFGFNPLKELVVANKSKTDNLNTNLNLSYELIKGLKAIVNLGYTMARIHQSSLKPGIYNAPPNDTNPNSRFAIYGDNNRTTWSFEPQITYNRSFGKHNLDLLIGSTFQNSQGNSLFLDAWGFSSDAQMSNAQAATNLYIEQSEASRYRYNAIYGRISYTYNDRYLLNLTARRDGSSRFGPGKQFGNFGAIGLGWIFSKEKFVEDNLPFLSFGKLRGSIGVTGNDQISDYQFLSTYSVTSYPYQGTTGLNPTRIANPYFAWERNRKVEGGVELGFLKDRLRLTLDYYNNRSGNQLIGNQLPDLTGFNSVQANFPAEVQNSGWEAVIETTNMSTGSLHWSSSFNITVPRNKLRSFPGIENTSYKGRAFVGEPLATTIYYHYTGIDPQTGLYTFQDVDGDGRITGVDMPVLKAIQQNFYGGLQNSFSYKNWELGLLLSFVKQNGKDFILANLNQPGAFLRNMPVELLDRWTTPGEAAKYQKFSQSATVRINSSDEAITDASFIRLKNVSLSYTLPARYLEKVRIKKIRIYMQGQNLFTITGYKGYDPESQGLALPPLRMLTAGINCSF